jgi:hypothetical protein
LRVAFSVEYIIWRKGLQIQPGAGSRRTVTVGSAKHQENFRDIETALQRSTMEALEHLEPGEVLLGMGAEPWNAYDIARISPCRATVTLLDLPPREMDPLWHKVRAITPLICAVAASSPFDSSKPNGVASNSLLQHIRNSSAEGRPLLALERRFNYGKVEGTARSSMVRSPFSLDEENGVVQVSIWDAQECAVSNLAMVALLSSLMRAEEVGQDASLEDCERALELAARFGTARLKDDLSMMLDLATENALAEERMYLPIIRDRVERGSLGETMPSMVKEGGMEKFYEMLARSLRTNRPVLPPGSD